MSLAGAAAIDIFSIAILAVIYHHSLNHDDRKSVQHKLYMLVLQVTALMLLIDILSRLDGRPDTVYPIINHVGNFLIFLLSPIVPSVWLIYVHLQVFREEAKTRRLLYPLLAIIAANAAMTTLTLFFGWYYYIDQGNIYHRGPLYMLPASITVALMLTAFITIIANRKRIDRKHYFPLVFFAVPPLACIILQILFYGMSLILSGIVLSLLVVFLNVQNQSMYADYLTGVSNRKKLEAYLEEKIGASTEGKTFAAILLDLDNFKSINDTFGHDMGDKALRISAELLKSCVRSDDLIARFGGDEFCVILDTSDRTDLEVIVRRIDCCLAKYNESSDQPYKLGFSMGHAVYDYHSHMQAKEFQKLIDTLMYEDKKRSGPHVPGES